MATPRYDIEPRMATTFYGFALKIQLCSESRRASRLLRCFTAIARGASAGLGLTGLDASPPPCCGHELFLGTVTPTWTSGTADTQTPGPSGLWRMSFSVGVSTPGVQDGPRDPPGSLEGLGAIPGGHTGDAAAPCCAPGPHRTGHGGGERDTGPRDGPEPPGGDSQGCQGAPGEPGREI